jgi:uncharacterized membrane protein
MSTYAVLRFAHVLLAVIAVGGNLTYALWLRHGESEPDHLAYTIRGIRRIDRTVANPAYALLLATGLAMMLTIGRPWEGWLVAALVIYLAAAVIGYFVFGPVVRRELAALERGGVADLEYRRLRGEAQLLSIATTAMVIAILALMVLKPF